MKYDFFYLWVNFIHFLLFFTALEDSGDTPVHPVALRRCVSATTTQTSNQTDLGYQGDSRDVADSTIVHPSIDDLRKQVSKPLFRLRSNYIINGTKICMSWLWNGNLHLVLLLYVRPFNCVSVISWVCPNKQ